MKIAMKEKSNFCRYLVFFVVQCVFAFMAGATPYRFVTFNVWGDYFGNPPNERDVQQVAILRKHKPHFIALQEMTANFWSSRLIADLADDYVAVGGKEDSGGIHSYTPILFKKDSFSLLEKGTVLFHPELDVSKGVTWVAVADVKTGEKIVAFSTHFWWRTDGKGDEYIRVENARRLHAELSAVAARHSAAVVGGGDLNSIPGTSPIAELNRLGWRSAQETAPGKDTRPTWHGSPVRGADGTYRGVPLKEAEKTLRLDYAFYDPSRVQAYEFRVATGGRVEDLSDHYPLVFDFLVHEKRKWEDPPKAAALSPRKPAKGSRPIVRYSSDSVGFVRGVSEEALWRIANGELKGVQAKAIEIELDAEDERTPIAAICGVRAVLDELRNALPDAVLLLRPFVRYGRRDAVNRELRHLADGKRIVWCGDERKASKPKELRTCVPQARIEVSGSRGKWWWLNRLEEKQNEIAGGNGVYDVVMLGDSITHFWEDFTYWSCGRDVFDGMRKHYALLNLGYGGDHTENVLWRCENGELDGYKAKIVQIMIGTNNGGDSPEDTALGIKRIIEVVMRKQPEAKILLLPIFPRGRPGDGHRARIGRVNEIIKSYADGSRVVWYDFTERFLEPDGEFRKDLMIGDLLHPHHAGYELWRDAVMPKFAEMLKMP